MAKVNIRTREVIEIIRRFHHEEATVMSATGEAIIFLSKPDEGCHLQ